MLRNLLTGLGATLLLASAQASVVVQSYSMQDGANLHGAYYDNGYNGSNTNGYLSGGTGDLTDGVLSASVAAGYGAWAPYVMWDGLSPVIVFDFGTRHDLSSITLHFKYYAQAAVYMPASLGLRFSDDGTNYGGSQLRSLSSSERVPGGNDSDGVFQVLNNPASGRYLELTLNNGPENRWLALGEVVFGGQVATTTGSGQDVPEPGSLALVAVALSTLALALKARPRP